MDGKLKLIDLGSTVSFELLEVLNDQKLSLAYVCPELAQLYLQSQFSKRDARTLEEKSEDALFGKALSPSSKRRSNNNLEASASMPNIDGSRAINPIYQKTYVSDQLSSLKTTVARSSMDIWSTGVVFYQLLTGENLFLSTLEDNIDKDQVELLAEWPEFTMHKRLEKIPDLLARNLVSQMLAKDPDLRPSASYCLSHPYISRSNYPGRFPGMKHSYDSCVIIRRNMDQVRRILKDASKAELMSEKDSSDLITHKKDISIDQNRDERKSPKMRSYSRDSVEETSLFDGSSVGDSRTESRVRTESRNGINSITGTSFKELDHCYGKDFTHYLNIRNILWEKELKIVLSQKENRVDEDLDIDAVYKSIPLYTDNMDELASNIFINLSCSRSAILILSRDSSIDLEHITADTEFDEFYFQMRLLMELSAVGLIENGIFVVAAGEIVDSTVEMLHHPTSLPDWQGIADNNNNKMFDSYFQNYMGDMIGMYGGSHLASTPSVTVQAVEDMVAKVLKKNGFGAVRYRNITVSAVYRYILNLPIYYLMGYVEEAYQNTAECIQGSLAGITSEEMANLVSIVTQAKHFLSSRPASSAMQSAMSRSASATPVSRGNTTSASNRFNKSGSVSLQLRPIKSSFGAPGSRPITADTNFFRIGSPTGVNISRPDTAISNKSFLSNGNSSPTSMPYFHLRTGTVNRSNTFDQLESLNDQANSHAVGTNPIVFYDQNIKLPYFTELVGEEKATTTAAMTFMAEKLEVKEIEISNLQQELAMAKEQLKKKQEEIADLRYKMNIVINK